MKYYRNKKLIKKQLYLLSTINSNNSSKWLIDTKAIIENWFTKNSKEYKYIAKFTFISYAPHTLYSIGGFNKITRFDEPYFDESKKNELKVFLNEIIGRRNKRIFTYLIILIISIVTAVPIYVTIASLGIANVAAFIGSTIWALLLNVLGNRIYEHIKK